jgi:uncharacterized damage-inducible protein DinB
MTPVEREQLLNNLAGSSDRLRGAFAGLSREQRHYKPAPDRWSVAEIVEHLTTVEARLLEMLQKALEAPADSSKRSAMTDQAMIADVAGRITRFQAPEFLAPSGRTPDEIMWQSFDAARKRTRDFAASTNADLRGHLMNHPVLGDLDCYQWLLLLAAHCDRHRVQGEEVKASAGFPRAASAN